MPRWRCDRRAHTIAIRLAFPPAAGVLSEVETSSTSQSSRYSPPAWGKAQSADGKVQMLADGNGDFARALDLEMDGSGFGLGKRSKRYAMVVQDGVVKTLSVENPGAFEVSSADAILAAL